MGMSKEKKEYVLETEDEMKQKDEDPKRKLLFARAFEIGLWQTALARLKGDKSLYGKFYKCMGSLLGDLPGKLGRMTTDEEILFRSMILSGMLVSGINAMEQYIAKCSAEKMAELDSEIQRHEYRIPELQAEFEELKRGYENDNSWVNGYMASQSLF